MCTATSAVSKPVGPTPAVRGGLTMMPRRPPQVTASKPSSFGGTVIPPFARSASGTSRFPSLSTAHAPRPSETSRTWRVKSAPGQMRAVRGQTAATYPWSRDASSGRGGAVDSAAPALLLAEGGASGCASGCAASAAHPVAAARSNATRPETYALPVAVTPPRCVRPGPPARPDPPNGSPAPVSPRPGRCCRPARELRAPYRQRRPGTGGYVHGAHASSRSAGQGTP